MAGPCKTLSHGKAAVELSHQTIPGGSVSLTGGTSLLTEGGIFGVTVV